jgi:carbonic anhydrase/acetyltransferase-like protein (isoleucine patch superfamily)
MPIYALGDIEPEIHPTAFVHPDAIVIGNVRIGEEASIWPAAVLRGDSDPIIIGARSNVQDGSVLHVSDGMPTTVGDDVLIGHLAHLESCTVHDGAFIGTASLVLHRAVIGKGAVVAGNCVVLDDTHVPPGALARGVPATITEGAAKPAMAESGARWYVENSRRYLREMRRIG